MKINFLKILQFLKILPNQVIIKMPLALFSSFNDLYILFMVTKSTFQLFTQCLEPVKAFFTHIFLVKFGHITCISH